MAWEIEEKASFYGGRRLLTSHWRSTTLAFSMMVMTTIIISPPWRSQLLQTFPGEVRPSDLTRLKLWTETYSFRSRGVDLCRTRWILVWNECSCCSDIDRCHLQLISVFITATFWLWTDMFMSLPPLQEQDLCRKTALLIPQKCQNDVSLYAEQPRRSCQKNPRFMWHDMFLCMTGL